MHELADLLRRVPPWLWVVLAVGGLLAVLGAPRRQDPAYPLGSEDIQEFPETYGIKTPDPWDWLCPVTWVGGRCTPSAGSHRGWLAPYNPYDDPEGAVWDYGRARGIAN